MTATRVCELDIVGQKYTVYSVPTLVALNKLQAEQSDKAIAFPEYKEPDKAAYGCDGFVNIVTKGIWYTTDGGRYDANYVKRVIAHEIAHALLYEGGHDKWDDEKNVELLSWIIVKADMPMTVIKNKI